MDSGRPSTLFPHLSSSNHFSAVASSGNLLNNSINEVLLPFFTPTDPGPWNTQLGDLRPSTNSVIHAPMAVLSGFGGMVTLSVCHRQKGLGKRRWILPASPTIYPSLYLAELKNQIGSRGNAENTRKGGGKLWLLQAAEGDRTGESKRAAEDAGRPDSKGAEPRCSGGPEEEKYAVWGSSRGC